jgi:hypothetical protein
MSSYGDPVTLQTVAAAVGEISISHCLSRRAKTALSGQGRCRLWEMSSRGGLRVETVASIANNTLPNLHTQSGSVASFTSMFFHARQLHANRVGDCQHTTWVRGPLLVPRSTSGRGGQIFAATAHRLRARGAPLLLHRVYFRHQEGGQACTKRQVIGSRSPHTVVAIRISALRDCSKTPAASRTDTEIRVQPFHAVHCFVGSWGVQDAD